MNMIDAIIFDMDGVLVDSEPLHFEAYRELIGSFDGDYDEEFNSRFLGQKDIEIAPLVIEKFNLPHSPIEFVRAKDEIFYEQIRRHARPMPGVIQILKQASELDITVGLASSSRMSTIDLIVDTLKIRTYFSDLTSGDHVSKGKPAPDIFLLSARRLGVEPRKCLVIEDTEHGVEAAKSAGMNCIAVPCQATAHQKHKGADSKLSSLEELDLTNYLQSS